MNKQRKKSGRLRSLLLIGVAMATSLVMSCDPDIPIGFNVGKEFPVELPVQFDATFVAGIPGFNPPPVEAPYDLNSVPGFGDALEDPENVTIVFESMSYEITDVSTAEEFAIDAILFSVEIQNGPTLDLVSLSDRLTNVPKTDMGLTTSELDQLRQALASDDGFTTSVTFDFAEAPTTNIDINVRIYVDVTLEVRQ
jgi:hypothetical protein